MSGTMTASNRNEWLGGTPKCGKNIFSLYRSVFSSYFSLLPAPGGKMCRGMPDYRLIPDLCLIAVPPSIPPAKTCRRIRIGDFTWLRGT